MLCKLLCSLETRREGIRGHFGSRKDGHYINYILHLCGMHPDLLHLIKTREMEQMYVLNVK